VRLSTSSETCDARNHLVHLPAASGTSLSLMDTDGVLRFGHNWVEPGYRISFGTFSGTVTDDGTNLTGTSPGFVNEAAQDFRLGAASACRDAGAPLDSSVLPDHALLWEYVAHQGAAPRPEDAILDIGAYEFCAAALPSPVTGLTFDADRLTLRWSAGSGALAHDVLRGWLDVLRATSGSFLAAADACVGDDVAGTSLADPFVPAPGEGVFWLVRGVGCGAVGGTWGDGGTGQVAPRDPGGAGCP